MSTIADSHGTRPQVWFEGPLGRFRVGLLVTSALVVITALVELGSHSHTHLVSLTSGVVLGGSLLLVTFAPPGRMLVVVRVLAGAVLGVAACSVGLHLLDNTTDPTVFNRHLSVYMSNLYPFTGWLGDATPHRIVPGLLAEAALLLLLATLGLDARRTSPTGRG